MRQKTTEREKSALFDDNDVIVNKNSNWYNWNKSRMREIKREENKRENSNDS